MPRRNNEKLIAELSKRGLLLGSSLEIGPAPKEWIQIMPSGKWAWHWQLQGPFEITEQHLNEMIANFDRYGLHLLGDCEHSSYWMGDSKAIGWGLELRISRDGDIPVIEARVEWTPSGLKSITEKEYKYISPVWSLQNMDDKSGEQIGARLFSFTLTNIPFFEVGLEQQLLANKAGATSMEFLKKIAALLGMAETATEEEVTAKVQALLDELKTLKDNATTASKKAPVIAANQKLVEAVLNELRLASTATPEEVVAAIKGRGEDEASVASRLATIEAKQTKDAAEQFVAQCQREGKLVAADLPWANEQAVANLDNFKSLMASAPVKVPLGKGSTLPAGSHNPSGTVTATDEQAKIASKLGVDPTKTAEKAEKLTAAR